MRGNALEQFYRRMVDENMVRKDISCAEMPQLALHCAINPHTAHRVMAILCKSAGYQKRSYIRNFIPLVQALGEVLKYTQKIPHAQACHGHRGRAEGLGHPVRQGRAGRAAPLCGAGG